MKNLLSELNKTSDLNLGLKGFSPIMQCSIGLAMKYHEKVKGGFKRPFHLNFPDKQDSALWLSVALLRNYFFHDYIYDSEGRLEQLNLKFGDIIKLFGANAKYLEAGEKQFKVTFKDGGTFYINNGLSNHIIKDDGKPNKYAYYAKRKKLALSERNAISKLIEPKGDAFIEPGILTSKILIISGRGNAGKFAKKLKQERLYNIDFYELFNCGQNLIIKPDLEDYTFLGKTEDPITENKFKQSFKQFIKELYEELPEKRSQIDCLDTLVTSDTFRTKEFKQLFDDVVSECSQESKYHKIRDDYYPGIKEQLPENLKSVIINDITQLYTYEGVIQAFLNRGIPVLIISNRYIDDRKELSFFSNYFKTHSEDLRISWDKNKISALSNIALEEDPLDFDLWKKCLKFSNQKISIETTDAHPVDELLINVQRAISKLEGQERLRTAYWAYFSPLLYSFKNDTKWYSYYDELKDQFLSVFEEVNHTLDENLKFLFYEIFNKLDSHKNNLKVFDSQSLLFGQQLDLNEAQIIFPSGDYNLVTASEIDSSLSQITFPGFPLNEPLHNNLLNVISDHIIEDVKILCWPNEGKLTYNYISKSLNAGYFTDNIPDKWGFPDKLFLNDETDIQKQIDEVLLLDSRIKQEEIESTFEDEEEILKIISEFKYSAYQNSHTGESDSKVKCNIIDLQGNKFMFLPKTSSVLAKIETEGDRYEIKKVKFNELNPGDEIFQYELSRSKLRELSKEADYQDNVFGKLELWKNSLRKSWAEEGCDLKKLENRLHRINSQNKLEASPSYQNLRNWLFDDDMLSPDKDNLQMILMADSDPETVNLYSDINDAYKKARGLSRRISSEIKKMIIKKLNSLDLGDKSHFEIDVFGSPMIIDFSKIKELQKTDFEVEYQHTRKFKQT